MKRNAPTLALALVMAVTIGIVALTQVAPARAARDVAMEQFSARVGDCVSTASLGILMDVVDAEVANAKGRSGWIDEGVIFIGSIDRAAESVSGEVLASDADASWVFSDEGSKRLIGLRPRTVGGVQAFVVYEISRPC